MLIKKEIRNNFISKNSYKTITIPIADNFYPVDYTEDIDDLVLSERQKSIPIPFDGETVKYNYINVGTNDLYVQFRFWNTTALTYDIAYEAADIPTFDVKKNRNGFKKSFFRLYFYDNNSGGTNNILFTEDLDVDYTVIPRIKLNGLYWLRNDDYFKKNNLNRKFYVEARFFNAKTGIIKKFINTPLSITAPLDIVQYSNPNNHAWRYSTIELINPKLNINKGFFNFTPEVCTNCGANTLNVITFSEFVLI